MKPDHERYSIAVDFDGVLHQYVSPWAGAETIPDPPVPGAIDWLLEMARHFTVYIHTTRAKTPAGAMAVYAWLRNHAGDRWSPEVGDAISVTNRKPPALMYVDDRAFRFEGRFPTRQEIHEAVPWNKRHAVAKQA